MPLAATPLTPTEVLKDGLAANSNAAAQPESPESDAEGAQNAEGSEPMEPTPAEQPPSAESRRKPGRSK